MIKQKISFFVPVYNGEEILEKNILKIDDFVSKTYSNYEIFIVDDNSDDNTQAIGEKLSSKNSKIKYLRYNFGPTRRENLAKSFNKAEGKIICFMDLDLATDLKFLKPLISSLRDYNLATGSRYLKKSKINRTLKRRIISFIYNNSIKLLFGSKINDHQCGFKAFKRNKLLKLVKDMGFDKSLKRGWFWDAELLIKASMGGFKIAEIPVVWNESEKSSFSIKRELRMLSYIIKMRQRLRNETK